MMEDFNRPSDTETLILRAAEKEFLEKGYSGARTSVIAEAAGVTHAMLHYYFRTKERLFDKIVAGKMDKLGELLLGAINKPGLPLKDRIRQGIENHFDFLVANPDLPRFIINELAEHPKRIELIRNGLLKKAYVLLAGIQEEIDMLAAENDCESVDARMLLVDIVSLNIFSFVAAPIVRGMAGSLFDDYETFLRLRRSENVRTILGKLRLAD